MILKIVGIFCLSAIFMAYTNCAQIRSPKSLLSTSEGAPPPEGSQPPTPPTDPILNERVVGNCLEYDGTYNPKDFDNVIENFDRTTTLNLIGSEWDNTLVRNCKIHDTGAQDGIFLQDVKNVVITNCEIYNVGGHSGIRSSVVGVVEDIVIDRNKIYNLQNNGINMPQRITEGTDSIGGLIINNTVYDSGLSGSDGKTHHIYTQGSDVVVSGNSLYGIRNGNAISDRSSGRISCNRISGSSKNNKPAIRYFSDHSTGPSNQLTIQSNLISGQDVGIDIFKPVESYDGMVPNTHVVKKFTIDSNIVQANGVGIQVDPTYTQAPFEVMMISNK